MSFDAQSIDFNRDLWRSQAASYCHLRATYYFIPSGQNLDLQALAGLVNYLRCFKHRCACIVATHCDAFEQVVDFNINLNSAVIQRAAEILRKRT